MCCYFCHRVNIISSLSLLPPSSLPLHAVFAIRVPFAAVLLRKERSAARNSFDAAADLKCFLYANVATTATRAATVEKERERNVPMTVLSFIAVAAINKWTKAEESRALARKPHEDECLCDSVSVSNGEFTG